MATNEGFFHAPPERVWEVLSDPRCYAEWVVGSKEIRRWDPEWPAVGSTFHHTFLIGPIPIKDSTSVLEADAPRYLLLRARARPTGVAHISLELTPQDGGTRVVMNEWPVEGPAKRFDNPLQERAIHHRNIKSLDRLQRLAERR